MMMKSSKLKLEITKNAGFTLIEILTIVGILTAITATAIPAFHSFYKALDLTNSTQELIQTLILAQNKTLASEGASQWGVHFDTSSGLHQFTLFKGADYATRDTFFDKIHKLPKTVEIYGIDLQGGNEVVFERVNGEASQIGNLGLRLINNPSKTETICIARYIINFCGPVPLGGIITDSRHVHFYLGWSIQNATTLKFDFVDAGQIETIDMAGYFKSGKTKFDWRGEFIVEGAKQEYRVHTHFLDAFDTLLCIHRNGNNTEAVTTYIVDAGIDKEIVHYRADGTGVVGPYGGTFEIQ